MICFKGKSYCSDAEQCGNKESCSRWFSPAESDAAKRWWGHDGAPVAMAPFKDTCPKWVEK